MRFLLDTNVVSETIQPRADRNVTRWIARQTESQLAISAFTFGEISVGLGLLPRGPRRERLARWLFRGLPALYADRVLPVDEPVALAWGRLKAQSKRRGRPLPEADGLILATALARNLIVVTRNVRHSRGWGVPVHNPWSHDTRD